MKWEYLTIILQSEKMSDQMGRELNAQGKLQWELVHVTDIPAEKLFRLWFKRPIEEDGLELL